MSGLLGYLSILADDIGSLAGKTAASAAKTLASSLDDIGILFDDIASYTKLATVKSSGLLVDDLAAIANFTNETTSAILKNELKQAKSVDDFKENIKKLDEKSQKEVLQELENIREIAMLEARRKAALRELPIVYKIAKGSFINKFIIIPIVLLLSYLAPWAIAPVLIIGGAYLAFEGVESILEKISSHKKVEKTDEIPDENFEDKKVKSAIKTDFILSFEIIVISLSLLDNSDFFTKLMVLVSVGILTTILVYGIVALIIKLDDIGFYLQEKRNIISKKIGNACVNSMPYIIKAIGILGTIAMLAVGGGIIAHETHILQTFEDIIKVIPLGGFFSEIILGAIVGYIVVLAVDIFSKIIKVFKN